MLKPHKGEIHRIHIKDRGIDVLILKVIDNRVYFVTLGRGLRSSYPLSVFCLTSEFLETRVARLRRACEHYRLTKTNKWMKSWGV